jgi:hypothetical protein
MLVIPHFSCRKLGITPAHSYSLIHPFIHQGIMARRDVYLAKSRPSSRMRAHFGILIPNEKTPPEALHLHTSHVEAPAFLGTIIHVVGAPMAGFCLEFKRNFDANRDQDLKEVIRIGSIDETHVADPPVTDFSRDEKPICALEVAATKIPPPKKSENFLAPVNDVSCIDVYELRGFADEMGHGTDDK